MSATQQIYKDSDELVRPKFEDSKDEAAKYYLRYLEFVRYSAKEGTLLDVGCGEGWSTLFLKKLGIKPTGMDLHQTKMEASRFDSSLKYVTGDIQELPFENEGFDNVAMYQVLEHILDPRLALEESLRVLKPGGRLIVVGPNIISFVFTGFWAFKHTVRVLKSGKVWENRTPDLARHPGGNTMPESLQKSCEFLLLTMKKLAGEKPVDFVMREPDTKPPFFQIMTRVIFVTRWTF